MEVFRSKIRHLVSAGYTHARGFQRCEALAHRRFVAHPDRYTRTARPSRQQIAYPRDKLIDTKSCQTGNAVSRTTLKIRFRCQKNIVRLEQTAEIRRVFAKTNT